MATHPHLPRYLSRCAIRMVFWSLPLVPCHAFAQALPLSLHDAFELALRNSSAVAYAGHEREAAGKSIEIEKSRHIPAITLSALSDVSASGARTLSDYAQRKTGDYYVAVEKSNSLGGVSSLGFLSQKEDLSFLATGTGATEYSAHAFFRYDQPLLRGFGPAVNNAGIDRAVVGREAATKNWGNVRAKALFEVYRDYFELYGLTEELKLMERIRKETETICGMLREKVEARNLPVTELKTMEAALFTLDKQLLDLRNRKTRQKHRLLLLLNGRFPEMPTADQPLSTPPERIIERRPATKAIAEAAAIMEGLDQELIEQRAALAILELERLKAQDCLKPDLKLSVEVGLSGNDSNERVNSISNISTDNYRATVMGTLSFPALNTAARGRLAVAASRIEQAKLRIRDRRNEIRRTVADLYADSASAAEKLVLDIKLVTLARENLDNEIERLTRGKSTSLNTVEYQTKYIEAQRQTLRTTIEYVLLIGSYYLYTQQMETVASLS